MSTTYQDKEYVSPVHEPIGEISYLAFLIRDFVNTPCWPDPKEAWETTVKDGIDLETDPEPYVTPETHC